MPFRAFEGPAGTGKTHNLMQALEEAMLARPLASHERVLALTFMHGSRRRLDQRLSKVGILRGRYSCMTIDSLASAITQRWASLAREMALQCGSWEETANSAGCLLENPSVLRWLSATFPLVVVDEAQDLSPERLRLVKAFTSGNVLLIAADEFQCLDRAIDTKPFVEWLNTGEVTPLTKVHRTNAVGLLDAASVLRAGRNVPASGKGFKVVYTFPNQMPFSIGYALLAGLQREGDVAMLVGPGGKDWASDVIARLSNGLRSTKQTVPPLTIGWETAVDDEVGAVMRSFKGTQTLNTEHVLVSLAGIPDPPNWLKSAIAAVRHQHLACGQTTWDQERLKSLMDRRASFHRAHCTTRSAGVPVMSINSAKNREYRHVVVLWPPGVPGDEEQQRRLLYNAVTRAREAATVFVRTEALLSKPPFKVAT